MRYFTELLIHLGIHRRILALLASGSLAITRSYSYNSTWQNLWLIPKNSWTQLIFVYSDRESQQNSFSSTFLLKWVKSSSITKINVGCVFTRSKVGGIASKSHQKSRKMFSLWRVARFVDEFSLFLQLIGSRVAAQIFT